MELELIDSVSLVRPLLKDLDSYYPNMEQWLDNLEVCDTTPILVSKDKGIITGVAIGKKSEEENKLRCIRVMKDYRYQGLGIRLMDRMFEILEDEHPLCTVSEEMMHQYSRSFVNRYGFSLDEVNRGMYRKGKLEYVFNK